MGLWVYGGFRILNSSSVNFSTLLPTFAPMKKPYNHLFFDLDHTLWDFEANARLTLEELFHNLQLEDRGVYDFNLFYQNYLAHNEMLWERYRKG